MTTFWFGPGGGIIVNGDDEPIECDECPCHPDHYARVTVPDGYVDNGFDPPIDWSGTWYITISGEFSESVLFGSFYARARLFNNGVVLRLIFEYSNDDFATPGNTRASVEPNTPPTLPWDFETPASIPMDDNWNHSAVPPWDAEPELELIGGNL